MLRVASRLTIFAFIAVAASCAVVSHAQTPAAVNGDEQLEFVIYLSRHGVRSPTGEPGKYARYSAEPWPEWSVPPGYLTAHGYQLMKLFGAYDRTRLAAEGLIAPTGCADAARTTILADSDQRTRETAKALAEGMFPGCLLGVSARPEGIDDPLFHASSVAHRDRALAMAAVKGRIGGDPDNLTEAFRPQLAMLDRMLAGCGYKEVSDRPRTSLFDIASSLGSGSGGHSAQLHGPLTVASSIAETLLLEYTEGMTGANLGWGCLDEASLRQVMQLHTAEADFTERTPAIARMYASSLLDVILKALEQHVSGKPVAGAPGKPSDRILFLVGHDTNIATIAGALGLDWILDGRRDETPPGSALVFELWRARTGGAYSVRVYDTAQTLEQMRDMQPLTQAAPPAIAPIFVPGCSQADLSCSWDTFAATIRSSVKPLNIAPKP